MKSRFVLIALLLAVSLLLCGCAPAPKAADKPLPDCETLAQAILDGQTFDGEMTHLTEKRMLQYLGLDTALYSQAVMWVDASKTTPEMVIVITAVDKASAEKVASSLEAFRVDIMNQYRGYKAGEAPKLENASVQTNGLQVVLAVAPDANAAKTTLQQNWK